MLYTHAKVAPICLVGLIQVLKIFSGETYEEITQLLQGYVQNEVDLNPEGTCRENCAEYAYTKSHGCFGNQYCRQQRRCNGKILDCRYFDSDMWICPAVG